MKAAGHDLEPVNILLVDDRLSNVLSLKALLERPDYRLVLARSGPEALAQVLRQEFAVILLDVAMPEMDGFETASIIKDREQSKLIPIIFVTASVYDIEHILRGYTVGAVDYLRKPIDGHALRSKVAVFVELFRQRKQIERQAARLREVELREQRELREQAEKALRESESLYQLTFEQAPVGIGHASPDGHITTANPQFCEILGYELAQLVGRPLEDLAGGEESDALGQRIAQLRAGSGSYSGEHQLVTGRGALAWVGLTLSALQDSGRREVRQLIVVISDISARKEVELEKSRVVRELQEGVRARDDFLSIAAHELKTPITPLRLQTASLLRDLERAPDEPVPGQHLLKRLTTFGRAAERLESLIDRLLDVSRLSVGAISIEIENVDLVTITREVVRRLHYEAQRAGSSMGVHADVPVVGRWDRLRIEQVVTNLLSNAIKYGAGKPIEVRVTTDEGIARFSVRDHGIGIPAEARARIFERFERVAPIRHYGGFGLGLWIVRQLVEVHSGRVNVWSEPEVGSEFTVELPLRPEVADTAEDTAARPPEAHP